LGARTAAGALFILIILLNLGLLWFNRYIPTQDGPTHLENAVHLRDLVLPGEDGVERHYRLNWRTGTNLFYHVAVGAFATVLPPLAAERLFLSLYLVAFAAATYALARAAGARTALPALAALPYALAFPFHMGFFNYCAGLVLAYAAWAYFWRRRDDLRVRDYIVLNGVAVLAYVAHVVPTVILLAGLFLLNGWLALGERRRGLGTLGKRLATFAALLPACIPPAFFTALYKHTWCRRAPWRDVLLSLLTGSSFRFYSEKQLYLGLASLGIVAAAVALRVLARRGKREPLLAPRNGLLLLAVGALALYFLAPDAGDKFSILTARLLVIPWPLLLIWAGDDFSRAGRWIMLVATAAFGLAFWGDSLYHYRQFNRELRDFCSGIPYVENGSNIAYLYYSGWQYRIAVFSGASSYYTLERDVVDFNNYEADLSIFPVNFDYPGFRPHPEDLWPPEKYRVWKFAPAVDYVITWDLPPDEAACGKLHTFYKCVHAQGRLRVFKVKKRCKERSWKGPRRKKKPRGP
jgi:hypothetical protein